MDAGAEAEPGAAAPEPEAAPSPGAVPEPEAVPEPPELAADHPPGPPPAALPPSLLTAPPPALPDDVLRQVLRQVEARWAGRVCAASRQLNRLGSEPALWRRRAVGELGCAALPPWCDDWSAAYRDGRFGPGQLGDCLEVLDVYGLWVTARVVARLDPLRLLVAFEGWSQKWALWVDRAADNELIRPLGFDRGECPGIGPTGPMTVAEFAGRCGATHARLAGGSSGGGGPEAAAAEAAAAEVVHSLWPAPTAENTARLPSMYRTSMIRPASQGPSSAASSGMAGRGRGGTGRAAGGRLGRGPGGALAGLQLATAVPTVTIALPDPAGWVRTQVAVFRNRGPFRSCRQLAASALPATTPSAAAAVTSSPVEQLPESSAEDGAASRRQALAVQDRRGAAPESAGIGLGPAASQLRPARLELPLGATASSLAVRAYSCNPY